MKQSQKKISTSFHGMCILSVLHGRTLHGYKLKSRIKTDLDENIPIGSLYRTLHCLERDRLVLQSPAPENISSDDQRRIYYQVTDLGVKLMQVKLNQWRNLIEIRESRMQKNED